MISFLMFAGIVGLVMYWFAMTDRKTGFLPGFATLLDRPEVRAGFANYLAGRSYLVGEFAGRKVMVLLEKGVEDDQSPAFLVVSMETRSVLRLDHSDFEDHARDREGKLALVALKARHDLRLALIDGCVKARSEQKIFRSFPGRFDSEKWRDVLEQMHALAGSLERRAA
jgi:hypothetical protein